MVSMVIMGIMVIRVIMLIRVIRVIRVTSVKTLIGILTHQGHISKVNDNVHSVTHSLTHSVTLITSRASCDAKKKKTFVKILVFKDQQDPLSLHCQHWQLCIQLDMNCKFFCGKILFLSSHLLHLPLSMTTIICRQSFVSNMPYSPADYNNEQLTRLTRQ